MISPSALLNDNTALVSLGASVPGVFARGVAAANNEGSARGKTLVVVQLAGGVDGLNTTFQHIGILSLEFHVDKLSRPLL